MTRPRSPAAVVPNRIIAIRCEDRRSWLAANYCAFDPALARTSGGEQVNRPGKELFALLRAVSGTGVP
jgi:hypothetical protein